MLKSGLQYLTLSSHEISCEITLDYDELLRNIGKLYYRF